MKEIFGYDFTDFIELVQPFIEDGALKKVYISENEVLKRFDRKYTLYIVIGDLTDYGKSFDIYCGDISTEGRFTNLMLTLLDIAIPELGKVTKSRSAINSEYGWEEII